MSPLNNFAAQLAGRRNAQPQSPQSDPNQNWNGQGQAYQSQPQHGQPQNGGYGQQSNFGQPSFTPAFQPMQEQAPQAMPAQSAYAPTHDPYAQHRAPAQQAQPQYQPTQGYGQPQTQQQAQPQAHQQTWQQPDPRGFDVGSYMTPAQAAAAQAATQYRNSPYQQQAEFDQGYAHQGQSQGHGDWNQGQGQDMGFAEAAGGELDPNYGDEQQDYEGDEAPRSRRPLMIAAALAGAIFVGGGLAYSYKSLFSGADGGKPPVVKSAEGPSKAKPADAGGKQFAHTDSKIMGRLGDGNSSSASSETDPNGTRKVSTLVVGRDGSIQAPPVAEAQPAPAAAAPVTGNGAPEVPGMMVVDAFSNNKPSSAAAAIAAAAPSAPQVKAPQKLTVAPPAAPAPQAQAPVTPVKIAKAETPKPVQLAPAQTGSVEPAAAEPVAPAAPAAVAPTPVKKPKIAAAQPAAPAAVGAPAAKSNSVATTGSGSNGFVAVLASVPRSGSSRMDALKRFADMQQKYGSVLAGKTPDVAEANLGAKGEYHRLVVGPPGSRDQASNVCTQLKSQGYGDCWVTAY